MRLFILMVVLVISFVLLGNWQWSVAQSSKNDQVLKKGADQHTVALQQIMQPMTEFNNSLSLRPVSVTGRYDAKKTVLIAGRRLNGVHGYWLMTPLIVKSNGARLSIVRGFVQQTTHLPSPPSGEVKLQGNVAPGESPSQLGTLPAGQIGTIDVGLLLNQWGGSVYNAFIFLTKQSPETTGPDAAKVAFIPPPVPHKVTWNLQNAAYAFQWWVFALFTIYMWFKMVRDDSLDEQKSQQRKGNDVEL